MLSTIDCSQVVQVELIYASICLHGVVLKSFHYSIFPINFQGVYFTILNFICEMNMILNF